MCPPGAHQAPFRPPLGHHQAPSRHSLGSPSDDAPPANLVRLEGRAGTPIPPAPTGTPSKEPSGNGAALAASGRHDSRSGGGGGGEALFRCTPTRTIGREVGAKADEGELSEGAGATFGGPSGTPPPPKSCGIAPLPRHTTSKGSGEEGRCQLVCETKRTAHRLCGLLSAHGTASAKCCR